MGEGRRVGEIRLAEPVFTPAESMELLQRAQLEHAICKDEWAAQGKQDPERLFTMHDIDAHLPAGFKRLHEQ